MIKYVIHCCPQRAKYVWNYLVPLMQKQGIDLAEIYVYNDIKRLGNLHAFMDCCRHLQNIPDDQIVWHMQDDVLISSDFAKITNDNLLFNVADIVCGFCCETFGKDLTGCIGCVPLEDMWYSFQCIGLKSKYMKECADWFYDEVIPKKLHAEFVNANKYDDTMFRIFMQERYPNLVALNLAPNIVEHIDVLIGGAIVNKGLPWRRSKYWQNEHLVEELINAVKTHREILM